MKATLWLSLADESWDGPHRVWRRTLWTDQAPAPGDEVVLWPGEEVGDGDGPQWPVVQRRWDFDGGVHVHLAGMVVDPDVHAQVELLRDGARGLNYAVGWFTEHHLGQPEPHLRRAGWLPYEQYLELIRQTSGEEAHA